MPWMFVAPWAQTSLFDGSSRSNAWVDVVVSAPFSDRLAIASMAAGHSDQAQKAGTFSDMVIPRYDPQSLAPLQAPSQTQKAQVSPSPLDKPNPHDQGSGQVPPPIAPSPEEAQVTAVTDHALAETAHSGSDLFSNVRHLIEAGNSEEIMFVFSGGQSLSRGTTLQSEFAVVWDAEVDEDRAFMLDFNHVGISARGWDHIDVDPTLFRGIVSYQSQITETPAASISAQILAAYDAADRIAPNVLNIGASAIGASILELMTSTEDVASSVSSGLANTAQGDLIVVPTEDGRYAYYVHDRGNAVYLNTHRHEPGLWDTMEAQIGFAALAAEMSGYEVHNKVAISFIHGQNDTALTHDRFGYSWAMTRYLEMIEVELAQATGRADLMLTVAMPQVRGDAAATVAFEQLALMQSDDRIHFGGTQMAFQNVYGSNPGVDNVHLTPEGYFHLGQSIGAFLGQALLEQPTAPITIDSVSASQSNVLTVTFAGLEGALMSDPLIFSGNPDIAAPDFFGFDLEALGRNSVAQDIVSATITGPDTITLSFDGDLSGALRLHLGRHGQDLSDTIPDRAFESYNGTTLRDSQAKGAVVLPQGYDGDALEIAAYVPTQYVDLWIDPW